ncbi:MAG: hypothetical protein K6F27_03075, partial [Ruminococcus sp.]|nr:hypothetical protein [Ruminococcus sp.]
MQLVQLVSFGCGIDAVTTDEVRAILEEKGKLFDTKTGYTHTKRIYKAMLRDFAALERTSEKKPKVGIVGEIYVK